MNYSKLKSLLQEGKSMREYCSPTEFQSVQQTMDELNSRWQQVTLFWKQTCCLVSMSGENNFVPGSLSHFNVQLHVRIEMWLPVLGTEEIYDFDGSIPQVKYLQKKEVSRFVFFVSISLFLLVNWHLKSKSKRSLIWVIYPMYCYVS